MQAAIKNIKERNAKAQRTDTPEAELRRLYEGKQLSQERNAKIFGRSKATVQLRMQKYGIEPRSRSEAAIIACKRHRHRPLDDR